MICPHCHGACEEQDRFCSHCGTPLNVPTPEKKGHHWVPILIMVLLVCFSTGLFFAFPGENSASPAGSISSASEPWFYLKGEILFFDESKYTGGSELTVPETIGGTAVVSIGEGCFENCTGLTTVYLPETLEAIGEDAFRGCTSLRGIYIPESVAIIGKNAFSGCSALEAVCLSDRIMSIGTGAFSNCNKLHYIYFLGYFEVWSELYGEFITPYTVIFCNDGSFYQGGNPY